MRVIAVSVAAVCAQLFRVGHTPCPIVYALQLWYFHGTGFPWMFHGYSREFKSSSFKTWLVIHNFGTLSFLAMCTVFLVMYYDAMIMAMVTAIIMAMVTVCYNPC